MSEVNQAPDASRRDKDELCFLVSEARGVAMGLVCEAFDLSERDAVLALADRAEALLEALRPFADAIQYLHPALPDDGDTLDGFKVSDVRRAAAAIAKAEGRA